MIAFASDRFTEGNIGDDLEIYIMNADGTGITRLTTNRVADAALAWTE